MTMPHPERRKWVAIIADMNRRINEMNELHYKERMKNLMK